MAKLKKNSKIKLSSQMDKSEFFQEKEVVPTTVPMLNVALTGSLDGGITSGLTVLAGPIKTLQDFVRSEDGSCLLECQTGCSHVVL